MSAPLSIVEVLPPEILAHILSFLSSQDICNVSKLCKAFQAAGFIDAIWEQKCLTEFPMIGPFIPRNGLSFRDVYVNLLHRYGKLLGLWQRIVGPYGGLLHVQFDYEKTTIFGTELRAPVYPNIGEPLRMRSDFWIEIDLTVTKQRVQRWCRCILAPALSLNDSTSQPSRLTFTQNQNESFTVFPECKNPTDGERWHAISVQDEIGANATFDHRTMMLRKVAMLLQNHNYYYTRLEMPKAISGAVIQPGLFKGNYSSHGVEIILLRYEDEHNVKGIKVTGDPNIPAGQITFKVNLAQVLMLDRDQQSSVGVLRSAERLVSPGPLNELPVQPFEIPVGVHGRDMVNKVPSFCKARFAGEGQIANDGYTNSSFISGHWIVFDENMFGFLWFDISSFALFHRVQEL